VEVLTTSAPARKDSQAAAPDGVEVGQRARFQDHLDVDVSGRRDDGDELLERVELPAVEERAAIEDTVDLVGSGGDGGPDLGDLDRERRAARREGTCHGGDPDRRPGQRRGDVGGEVGVDTDRGHVGAVGVVRVRLQPRPGELADPGRRVARLQAREVDEPDGDVDPACAHGRVVRHDRELLGPRDQGRVVRARQVGEERLQRLRRGAGGREVGGQCAGGDGGGHGHLRWGGGGWPSLTSPIPVPTGGEPGGAT
jgi:hypothetical protein